MAVESALEQFVVVINDEEQYSIWPEYRAISAGWRQVGQAADKESCLSTIRELWTDMRPLSLRRQMEAQQDRDAAAASDALR